MFKNILYKISTENKGWFSNSGIIDYNEYPFLKVDLSKLSIESYKLKPFWKILIIIFTSLFEIWNLFKNILIEKRKIHNVYILFVQLLSLD